MISKKLIEAREYEAREGASVPAEARPAYHLSPLIGWLNDPNGFSFYDGKYHMFYQYHPYDSHWGPMHWGHAVSDDMIRWEYLPAALAPDTDYDGSGCFSGSAITLPDGRQLLMYTGCATYGPDAAGRWRETQNLAVSDGDEFVKYEGNPVISDDDLPEYGDIYEFRDPYIWRTEDGTYRALVGNASASEDKAAKIVSYRSEDGFRWELNKVLFEDSRHIGIMWECPSFFPLDGKQILIASPMDMDAEEADGSIRFPKGNNVVYMVGDYDEESEDFTPVSTGDPEKAGRDAVAAYHPVDCGLDFYAPQVRIMPDGRCIMVGWMQDPSTGNLHDIEDFKIFGQMTVPRELRLRNNRLIQWPVAELDAYRDERTVYTSTVLSSEERQLEEISGRILDIELTVQPEGYSADTEEEEGSISYESFGMKFAKQGDVYTEIRYYPERSILSIDRGNSGQPDNITRRRTIRVRKRGGRIDLRILLDRWSAEVFINGGEQVMSATFYTPLEAQDITFGAEGIAELDVTEHRLTF